MTTTKQQLIKGIESNFPILNEKIKDGIDECKNYLESLKDEKYEEKENETEDDAIKRAESIYDRLDEMIKRNELSNKKALETIELFKKMTELFNGIVKTTNDEKEGLAEKNNELIHIIIDLEKRKTTKLIDQNPNRQGMYNGILEDDTKEWNELKIVTEKIKQEKKRMSTIIDDFEMKQIEEWSGMKIGNIIFDSNVDNWNVNTSVFDKKVINKRNLIFLIEGDDDNKFGGFVNAEIDRINVWITDPKSFVFSLKSNGRLNGMFKFNIKDSQYALGVWNQPNEYLFTMGIGGDICICKENMKNKSFCKHYSFTYSGIENALCGKTNFTPKRITVIQLI